MRAAALFLPLLAGLAGASRCRPRESQSLSSSLAVTSASASASSSGPAVAVPTTSSVVATTTTTADDDDDVSSPTTTSSAEQQLPTVVTTTSSAEEEAAVTTTSSADDAPITTSSAEPSTTETPTSTTTTRAPMITNFCIKHVTPGRPQNNYHLRVISPSNNIVLEAQTADTFARFDMDPTSGNLTMHEGTYAGYQVQAPGPFNNQATRVLRIAQAPLAASLSPLTCADPTGAYADGSVLECQASGVWDSGSTVRYGAFVASSSATGAVPWQVAMDGISGSTFVSYQMAMFFGSACSVAGPA